MAFEGTIVHYDGMKPHDGDTIDAQAIDLTNQKIRDKQYEEAASRPLYTLGLITSKQKRKMKGMNDEEIVTFLSKEHNPGIAQFYIEDKNKPTWLEKLLKKINKQQNHTVEEIASPQQNETSDATLNMARVGAMKLSNCPQPPSIPIIKHTPQPTTVKPDTSAIMDEILKNSKPNSSPQPTMDEGDPTFALGSGAPAKQKEKSKEELKAELAENKEKTASQEGVYMPGPDGKTYIDVAKADCNYDDNNKFIGIKPEAREKYGFEPEQKPVTKRPTQHELQRTIDKGQAERRGMSGANEWDTFVAKQRETKPAIEFDKRGEGTDYISNAAREVQPIKHNPAKEKINFTTVTSSDSDTPNINNANQKTRPGPSLSR